MNKNIVVISAHPDDEVLGAGGALLRHKEQSDNLYWIIVTQMFEEQGYDPKKIKKRDEEIEKVASALGCQKVFILKYKTMELSSISLIKMIPEIGEIFEEIQPETVYCVNSSDAHSDHRITFDAVAASTKSFRHPYVKNFLMYECISETEFNPRLHEFSFTPNYYIDITKHIDQKIDLMKIYSSEISEHPFPRSVDNIKALATFRGAIAGVNYAEAFQIVKIIDK